MRLGAILFLSEPAIDCRSNAFLIDYALLAIVVAIEWYDTTDTVAS